MANPYLGEVRLFAFTFAPNGWALCNGQVLAINTNQALFSLLGTNYGGNGTTTFQLPDLQGRVAMHQGNGSGLSSRVVGGSFGHESITLQISQIPGHNHLVTADGDPLDTVASNPSGHWLGPTGLNTPGANQIYSRTDTPATPVTMHPQMVGVTGGNQPHSSIQPSLVMNYCIALAGIFPSQN